jgi:Rad3-related DNA helicase
MKGKIQDAACQNYCRSSRCFFNTQLQQLVSKHGGSQAGEKRGASHLKAKDIGLNSPFDIEELLSYGKAHTVCPYFLSRELHLESELVFLPYNYVVDTNIYKIMNISLFNSVIIFDEGHNMEKALVCFNSFFSFCYFY